MDVKHKILRSDTALEFMNTIMQVSKILILLSASPLGFNNVNSRSNAVSKQIKMRLVPITSYKLLATV